MINPERKSAGFESQPEAGPNLLYIPNPRFEEQLPPSKSVDFSGLSFLVENHGQVDPAIIGAIGGGITGAAFTKAVISRAWSAVNKDQDRDYRKNSAVIIKSFEAGTKIAPVIASAWMGAKYPTYGIVSGAGVIGAGIIFGLKWLNRNVTEPIKRDRRRGMK